MTFGLQIFNSSSQLTLDVTDKLTRVLGTTTITLTSGSNQFVPNPAIYTSEYAVQVASNYDDYWFRSRPSLGNYYLLPNGVVVINPSTAPTQNMTITWLGF